MEQNEERSIEWGGKGGGGRSSGKAEAAWRRNGMGSGGEEGKVGSPQQQSCALHASGTLNTKAGPALNTVLIN